MFNQIKYFQSVVRLKNFTKAAEENFISQSAISQQIQSLEKELGAKLLKREGRKFSLTPAGEFFYRKSLVLLNDFDRILNETLKIANGEKKFSIGYLRHYSGEELKKSIAQFSEKYQEIFIEISTGTHEELYKKLLNGKVDLVLNDLRRKPSDQYVNFFLAEKYFVAEIPAKNPLSQLKKIFVEDLKNTPIILIAPPEERLSEEIYYREYFGVKSEIIFVENLEDAHLTVLSGRGIFLADFEKKPDDTDLIKFVPIYLDDKKILRNYYAFWRKENSRKFFYDFAEILKKNFDAQTC